MWNAKLRFDTEYSSTNTAIKLYTIVQKFGIIITTEFWKCWDIFLVFLLLNKTKNKRLIFYINILFTIENTVDNITTIETKKC